MANVEVFDAERLEALSAKFSGTLVQPGDNGYEEARRVHNGLIDKRPAVIARCQSAADVARAIGFAREVGLEISIRGGGHNVAGRACTEGGLMIDLAEMRAVVVDSQRRTARAQGGANWDELNAATSEHGLAVTGGAISTTGIAGLTLGGGLGWLMGLHGLAADNLVSVELVTADGNVLHALRNQTPTSSGLSAAAAGTSAWPRRSSTNCTTVTMVTGGLVAHSFAAAGEMLRFYREFTRDRAR